jgi:hypothetical protein
MAPQPRVTGDQGPTSNSKTVIASEAKQSTLSLRGTMDCFVAALLAMTAQTYVRLLAAPYARGLHRPCPSLRTEGAGKTGCALHPRSRVQCAQRNAHTSIQVQRRASGLPCAMVLRLMARSPRRRIRLVTVASGLKVLSIPVGSKNLRRLDTSNGCQNHTLLPYALAPSSCADDIAHGTNPPCDSASRRRCRVHRIPPRVS